MILVVFFSGR